MIIGDVLITGGSGGIGSAIVKELSDFNIKIYNFDKFEPVLNYKNTHYLNVNLEDRDTYRELTKKLRDNNKILNFIHCAGYGGPFVDIVNLSDTDWDRIRAINYDSAYHILKELLPFWKTEGYGRFIGIASSLSLVGKENSVAYSGAKHALWGFTKSIAAEWGEWGITANCISPGYVDTAMGIQETEVSSHRKKILDITPSKKIALPVEISRVVLFMLSGDSGYINGSNWAVDGGITAI